ncbi:MAG: NAD-dependent epimerase/dehydratase family protein [Gemmatimonadota bacterium]|nr:NAD-dependent epimerase/dehydratase family protein [Gemmatimonadota bacterium]
MAVAVVTGAGGLVGSQAVEAYAERDYKVVGIDNDMRAYFFGEAASTTWRSRQLQSDHPRYEHHAIDIRDERSVAALFRRFGREIRIVIHAASQPSHDWAAREPLTDFTINANGTLVLLENARRHCPDAAFIFTSTNKVYGDTPNRLPVVEGETRWDLPEEHPFYPGIDESMSLDRSTHSLFGASKVAADVLVQEYGRYFDMKTVSFRAGCITGPSHSGAALHGFLAYLVKCTATGTPYTVLGYKGKQVRDNIHSADLVRAFQAFEASPRSGAVYNIGGGRGNSCSLIEAIDLGEKVVGRRLDWDYREEARIGDHIWWISDLSSFQRDYPDWTIQRSLEDIVTEIYEGNLDQWEASGAGGARGRQGRVGSRRVG